MEFRNFVENFQLSGGLLLLEDFGGYLANDSLDTSKTLYYPTTTESGPGRINPASFSASSRPQSAPNLSRSLLLLAYSRLFRL